MYLLIINFCTLEQKVDISVIVRRVDYDNDIAILTLAEEVVFTDKIVPACLPGPDYHDYIGEELTISGWGNLGSYRGSADKLQVVKVPYVTNKICGGVETNYEPSELTDNMMCAGNITHGSIDTCQGDSGGIISFFLKIRQ